MHIETSAPLNTKYANTKVSGYVIRISLIAALGGFLFGFETAVISGAEKTIQALWNLSAGWQGFTVASSLIGTVIGSLIAGNPAQRYGRKKVLSVIAILYLLSAIGCAITPYWALFITFRFIGGLAVGASSVVGPMYISEVSPAHVRGRLAASFQLMIVTGIFVAYLTNFLFHRPGRKFLALDAGYNGCSCRVVCDSFAQHTRKPQVAGTQWPR